MFKNSSGDLRLRRAVRFALTGGSLAASCNALAQQAPAPAAADNTLTEVVVTGSRIAVPNEVSISPVTFVSSETIQQTGLTRIEDVLNELPQVFADQSSSVSNGSNGTATVNLRGLNAKRTLVLVDGDRLGFGDPRSGGAPSDINLIPTELIDSVEVLTGGASSIYGADAVAGVVNFKMNDHFEGVKLVADAGIYQHNTNNDGGLQTTLDTYNATTGNDFASAPNSTWGGATKSLTFIAGLNSADGNGNATFYATYRNIASVLQSKYEYSACTAASGFLAGAYANGGKFQCSGSSTSFPGRFYKLTGGTTTSDATIGPGGSLVPFTDANKFNYGPLNYYQRPDEEYTSGLFLHYEFNEHATVYSQSMFMDDRTIAQIAPSGAFFGDPYTVNCANPYLSAAELTAWCGGSTAGTTSSGGAGNGLYIGRRNIEGGNRQDDIEHEDWREVIGIKGKIDDNWTYDASFQYATVNLSDTYNNDVSSTKINYALNVVQGPNGPECAVTAQGITTGLAAGCVPWNIFSLGGVTPAAAAYIDAPGINRGKITQTIVNINATGDLGAYGLKLPTASSGLQVNLGLEYRDEKSFTEPDEEFQTGDLAGQGGATLPVSGGIISHDAFIEARMPLASDLPGAKSVNFDASYRFSSYTLGYDTNTFSLGLDYAPIQDVRLRGSFSRAVRAPNIVELFSTQSVGLDGQIDPCAGPAPNYSLAACERTGVTPAEYGHILANSAAQYNGLTGGNPNLQPETALTTSIGVGFTPSFLPGFRAQIDYYDIKIENVIETIGADEILTQCLSADLFCSDIHRSAIGSLWLSPSGYVTDLLANVGRLQEKGLDVDLGYAVDMGAAGKLRTGLTGTFINKYEVTPVAALGLTTSYNCAGYYGTACSSTSSGAGNPVSRWRNTLRTTWSTPWDGADLTVTWRYFSATQLETLSSNPNLSAGAGVTVANGGISNTDARIPSFSYIDLSASLKLAEKVTLRLGCNNVLDKSPPVIGTTDLPGNGNGNTFPGVYDSLGRYFFGQVVAQF